MSLILTDVLERLISTNNRPRWTLRENHRQLKLLIMKQQQSDWNAIESNQTYFNNRILKAPAVVEGFKLVGIRTQYDQFKDNTAVTLEFEKPLKRKVVKNTEVITVDPVLPIPTEAPKVSVSRKRDPAARSKALLEKLQVTTPPMYWIGDGLPKGYPNAVPIETYNLRLWRLFVRNPSRRSWFYSHAKQKLQGETLLVAENEILENRQDVIDFLNEVDCKLNIVPIKGDL